MSTVEREDMDRETEVKPPRVDETKIVSPSWDGLSMGRVKERLRLGRKKPGWWATHDYERRAVSRDVEEFVGWGTLLRIVEACETPLEKAFIATLFSTGARVSECLQLTRDMFEEIPEEGLIICRGAPLLKRYKKVEELPGGGWETETVEAYRRPFPLILQEPLMPLVADWIKEAHGYLFPSPRRPGKPLSRAWAFKVCGRLQAATGIDIWPHWFRSQRASQLVSDYQFELLDLLDFFSWDKVDTAITYTRRGPWGLARKMRPLPQYL